MSALTKFENPDRLLAFFLGLHLVLWTLVPWLTSPNAPLDVVEGFAWGREWLLGTYKHPPMQAWWLEILARLTGRADWAPFLASQIAVVIAFWAVWRTGRRIAGPTKGLLGVLLLEGVVYYNFTTPEFNPNVLQLPFWGLIGWAFYDAVKDDHWYSWVLLGVAGAGGLYTKYTTLILLGVLALLLVSHPVARPRFRGFGPYLALLVLLTLFAPHLYWLVQHDFQPLTYTESRMNPALLWWEHLSQPLLFVVAQIGALAAGFVLLILLHGRRRFRGPTGADFADFDTAFLFAVTWGPFAVVVALSLLCGFKLHDMWGSALWDFVGLWALTSLRVVVTPEGLRRFAVGLGGVAALGLLACAAANELEPYLQHKAKRVHFPGRELSAAVSEAWQKRFGQPLAYVVGDVWLAGNVAFYAPGPTATRPQVFIQGNAPISPWIDARDFSRRGAVVVWCAAHCRDPAAAAHMPDSLRQEFPRAETQKPLVLAHHSGARIVPATIGWALLPPTP